MDAASVDALTFVARRLDGARVAFLLARRPGRPGALEAVLSRTAVERIQVGSMSLGAVRRLLFERLGLAISHQRLRRIVEVTDGNPLFALEVGRSLLDGERSSLEHDVPVPDSLEELLGDRVARLPAAVRRVLLAVALSEDPRVDHLIRSPAQTRSTTPSTRHHSNRRRPCARIASAAGGSGRETLARA